MQEIKVCTLPRQFFPHCPWYFYKGSFSLHQKKDGNATHSWWLYRSSAPCNQWWLRINCRKRIYRCESVCSHKWRNCSGQGRVQRVIKMELPYNLENLMKVRCPPISNTLKNVQKRSKPIENNPINYPVSHHIYNNDSRSKHIFVVIKSLKKKSPINDLL